MKLFSFLVLFVGLISCAESQEKLPQDTYSDAYLIDVRTPQEFSQGSPDGAVNIPVDVIGQNENLLPTDKSEKIVVFCLSGGRSSHAQVILEEMGYTNVINGGTFKKVAEVIKKEKEQKTIKG